MKKIFTIILVSLLACGFAFANGASEKEVIAEEDQQLVIYTNSGSAGRAEWLTELAAENGFDIAVVSIPGGELTNRLVAEKNNSLADVVFGLSSVDYEKLKKETLLKKYRPTWADNFDTTIMGDSEGYYYPIVVQPLVLIYNTDMTDAPSDYLDLLSAQYTDRYSIFQLSGGTGKTIFSSILLRYPDTNGELGISDEGWKIGKQFIQNSHMNMEGEDYVGDVIDGSRPMSEIWGSGVIQNQTERNYEFGVMAPSIGVPYVVEQVAILSTTEKEVLAESFANWFGSTEVQKAWSEKFGSIPADPMAMESVAENIKEFMGKLHPQDMDWALVANNLDAWIEKAELEFVL